MIWSFLIAFVTTPPARTYPMSRSSQEQQQPPAIQAKARKEITEQYALWGKARMTFDKGAYDRMLADDFYCQLPKQKLDKKGFIDVISANDPRFKLTRFDSQILSLTKEEKEWVAVITEKIEYESHSPSGKPAKLYNVWVTRDGWREDGDKWLIAYSEAIGSEYWINQKPPIPNWG
jgi:hypothetical protein